MKPRRTRLVLALLAASIPGRTIHAASLTDKDVQLMIRAIAFMRPEPENGTVAIAYDPADPASRRDAETIAGYFGDGLKAGHATLLPRVVEATHLAAGGFRAIITASGANLDQVAAAARASHVPCLTGDIAQVRAGRCVIAVTSEPKVEIAFSRAEAARVEVSFASAFLMMVNQF